jgi:hypothetical protein
MRSIPGPKPGELRRYIPEAFDNRKDPQPVAVWIRNPTERKKREIFSAHNRTHVRLGADGKPLLDELGSMYLTVETADAVVYKSKLISDCVERVENYSAATGAAITDGISLADNADTEIFNEVADEILHGYSLTLSDVKNSNEPQPSRQAMSAPILIAANAEPLDSPPIATVIQIVGTSER